MNTILIILSIIALLIAAICIIALFMSESYTIEREMAINQPKQVIFDYLKLTRNHANFNKWWMMDPNMRVDYRGTDGVAGMIAAWDSDAKGVGAGEQETVKVKEGLQLDYEIRFFKPFKAVCYATISTQSLSGDQTMVKWLFKGQRTFGMRIMHLLLNIKKMLGKDLEISLTNLKAIMEKR
jgi:hypothetical protein